MKRFLRGRNRPGGKKQNVVYTCSLSHVTREILRASRRSNWPRTCAYYRLLHVSRWNLTGRWMKLYRPTYAGAFGSHGIRVQSPSALANFYPRLCFTLGTVFACLARQYRSSFRESKFSFRSTRGSNELLAGIFWKHIWIFDVDKAVWQIYMYICLNNLVLSDCKLIVRVCSPFYFAVRRTFIVNNLDGLWWVKK